MGSHQPNKKASLIARLFNSFFALTNSWVPRVSILRPGIPRTSIQQEAPCPILEASFAARMGSHQPNKKASLIARLFNSFFALTNSWVPRVSILRPGIPRISIQQEAPCPILEASFAARMGSHQPNKKASLIARLFNSFFRLNKFLGAPGLDFETRDTTNLNPTRSSVSYPFRTFLRNGWDTCRIPVYNSRKCI
jgi:hypothetical protein